MMKSPDVLLPLPMAIHLGQPGAQALGPHDSMRPLMLHEGGPAGEARGPLPLRHDHLRGPEVQQRCAKNRFPRRFTWAGLGQPERGGGGGGQGERPPSLA